MKDAAVAVEPGQPEVDNVPAAGQAQDLHHCPVCKAGFASKNSLGLHALSHF